MAGYSSRFFLSLTIPSVFGFLSVLWFLKRKNPTKSVNKSIQVEDSEDSDEFEEQFLTLVPMKLKNKEDSCDEGVSTEMQLKETQTTQSPIANGIHLNGKAKKSKSKMREKTCTFPKDYILNGSDIDHHTQEDNGSGLSNGIEAIDLNTSHVSAKDELLLNAINKAHIDMEITNSSQTCVLINGDADHAISDTDNPPAVQQNGGSAKEKCDTTDVQVCTEERNSDGNENEQIDIPPTVKIGSHEPLTLPVVCAETTKEMLESPGATYCDSVVVVDTFALERASCQEIVIVENVNSDDAESVVSETESDECVNVFVQENGDADVLKVEDVAIVCASIEDIPNAENQSTEKLNAECVVNVSNQKIANPPEQKVTYARVCASSLKNSAPKCVPNNRIQGAECVNVSGQSQAGGTSSQEISVPKSIANNRIHGAECANVSGQSQAEGTSSQEISFIENGIQGADGVNELYVQAEEGLLLPEALDSYDSGTGGSEINYDGYQVGQLILVYEFEILQEYVGLLIGRSGRHVRYIKEETNADILIKRHPMSDRRKVCAISGTEDEIHAALKLIRKRFPIETYPTITLSQIGVPQDASAALNAENLKLNLPGSSLFDVMLSATVNAGHFFLQQPTHPSFHSLLSLNTQMSVVYNEGTTAPPLPDVNTGYICVAKLGEAWYRAEIDEVFEDTDECRVKFLDYGGYMVLPRINLKQIRGDLMCMPFQASECYLGEVTYPEGVTDWSIEATAAFEELAQGQILQGYICGYAENRIPYVKLFKVTGVSWVDINAELVRLGHAKAVLPPNPQEV